MFNFSGTRPNNLGVKNGQLTACPGTPNCVNSQSSDPQSKIAPLPMISITELKKIIESMERTTIIEETNDYLYAEFKTPLMGFVDDVEFYLDSDQNVIHVRSASRLGKSDLGVNRKRVEEIRSKIEANN
ncbi:DUF1499-containing protein [Crocosphaera subtropica ATCC 51142]|uniref:DUF1499-containing protein n=1 Tax=Crocosphaera subtropica (strain ATCC 51142 / BH68) TaxID=43989 RepID=B1WYH4_CROS5|nr:DUF1499 domain-containing protein [Crocosphaera subtropica]ACB49404.1 DUF1499-containing protein [Crocosphaera subtropica ATCC 51142]